MSQRKVITGGGGKPKTPPTPTQTPDNLRSEDTVEMVLGITEGPWKGLTNGDKSLQIGDTALERQDGGRNFENFEATVYPGTAFPDTLRFKLGGSSSNTSVNVSTAYGVAITRQTEHGNIDAIDIRLVVNQLMKSVEQGNNPGVYDWNYNFRIKYKPLSATEWAEWEEIPYMTEGSGNPYVQYPDRPWGPDSYQSGGVWYDPDQPGLSWTPSSFAQAVLWAITTRQNLPGPYVPPDGLNIHGKTTSAYVKEYRIPVPRIPEPYLIRLERITPDSSLSGDPKYYAEVTWESFQTIDLTPKKYPYTGFLQIVAQSTDQFSSIPSISGEGDGMIVKVPTNFDPITRQYTGIWDGNWKEEWTNSPVWLLYEAIHNDRWGWSAYTPVSWSRYEAYALAQITDHILESGKPRYTFNAYLTEPMDGREFCRYIAGSFNSVIVDDDNGHVRVLMDKDDPAVALFGPESIVGDFEYTYTDVNTRYNDITVVFRNPDVDYNEDRRGIRDDDQIAQHGRIPFDFIAVGTTDQNEAVRKASRRLVSATTETEMVNFKTNRKAQYLSPYDIILITDPYKGYGQSGRFKSFTGSTITLRDPIYLEAGVDYGLEVQASDGIFSTTLTGVVPGWNSVLNTEISIPATVDQKAQFSLTEDGGAYGLPKPYRILDIKLEESPDSWTIMAIEVNRLKFAAEDDAEVVGEPQYTFPIKREPEAPENLKLLNVSRAAPDGTMIYEVRVDFTAPSDAYVNRYFIRYRQQGETEYEVVETDGSGLVVQVPRDGIWEFQAQARNIWNQQSLWIDPAAGPVTVNKNGAIAGGSISGVTGGVNQITLKVTYPPQTDIRYARIYENTTNNNATATFVGKTDSDTFIRTGLLGVVTRWYWVRFEDGLGNIGPYTTTGGVSGTTTQITAPDIQIGAITLEKFATGVTPVEIFSALPSTGNFVGRTVVLTTDGNLYNWTGSAWERTAPDPIGVGTEIGAVLPSTGNFEGRMFYLTTDDKLYRYTGSAWTAAVATTDLTGTIASNQIAANAISLTKFAAGLTPVEVLGALPSSGNFNGRTVFLTTDGKIYRYNGSSFTADVAAVNITGQLTASQIADGAIGATKLASSLSTIEILGTLPVSGNYEGRTVYLTTDDKLYRYNGSTFISTTAAVDITGQLTTTQITDNAITTGKIAAAAITANELAANSVIAGKIAAAAVTATELAAKAVTATKIAIGDTSNMVPDPDMIDPGAWINSAGLYFITVNEAQASERMIVLPVNASATSANSTPMAIEAGKQYYVSGNLQHGSGTATTSLVAQWFSMDSAGALTYISQDTIGTITASGANTFVSGIVTAPAGSRRLRVYAQRNAGGSAISIFGSPIVRRATSGELIVDGTITAAKIAADTITANEIASNAITANEIAANAVTAGKIAANAVTAGTIAAGAVTATELSAGAITASKLAVIDMVNFIIDPTFADAAMWTLNSQSPPWTINTDAVAVAALSSPRVLKSGAPSGTTHAAKYDQAIYNGRTPIELGGKPLRVSIDWYVTAGFTGRGSFYVYQYSPTGAYLGAILVGITTDYRSTAAASATTGNITNIINPAAGTGTIAVAFEMQRSPTLNNAGYMYLANPRASRAVNAELIVDGTITGTKLVAGTITTNEIGAGQITAAKIASNTITASQIQAASITGDRLVANTITAGQIAAGTITATQIAVGTIVGDRIAADTITGAQIAANAISATEIAAGAVTAVKINVSDLSAINANLGTITGGSLSINNKFIVASDGTVTIRNSTTGQRMVLTNTLLSVYDASNVLRVRLGIW